MLKLRGGTVAFQIEMGTWHGLKREEWVCKECDSGEVLFMLTSNLSLSFSLLTPVYLRRIHLYLCL